MDLHATLDQNFVILNEKNPQIVAIAGGVEICSEIVCQIGCMTAVWLFYWQIVNDVLVVDSQRVVAVAGDENCWWCVAGLRQVEPIDVDFVILGING